MGWIFLFTAGVFEIVWALTLKLSEGFSKPLPAAITVVSLVLSMIFMAFSLKTIPMGTAYAVWTGIGAVGTAVLGMWLFGEPRAAVRVLCIGLIIAGIAGLKLTSD